MIEVYLNLLHTKSPVNALIRKQYRANLHNMNETEQERRKRIKILYEAGITGARNISNRTGVPLRTCYNVLKRIRNGESVDRKPGSGRPIKLNGAARRRLAAIAGKNPKFSTVQVTERFNTSADTKISSSTFYRKLTEMGYLKFVPRKVPFITKRTKENRVMWAPNHCDFNWEKVVFTDESTFEFYRTKICEWAKERPNKGVPKNGPKIMIWGGISARGKTPLKIIIRRPLQISRNSQRMPIRHDRSPLS